MEERLGFPVKKVGQHVEVCVAMAGCGLLGSLCSLLQEGECRLMFSCAWGPVLLTSPSLSQAVELLASILILSHARICGTSTALYMMKEGVFCSVGRVDSL